MRICALADDGAVEFAAPALPTGDWIVVRWTQPDLAWAAWTTSWNCCAVLARALVWGNSASVAAARTQAAIPERMEMRWRRRCLAARADCSRTSAARVASRARAVAPGEGFAAARLCRE